MLGSKFRLENSLKQPLRAFVGSYRNFLCEQPAAANDHLLSPVMPISFLNCGRLACCYKAEHGFAETLA